MTDTVGKPDERILIVQDGGLKEVPLNAVIVADLWNVANRAESKHDKDAILSVWHLAHDMLKNLRGEYNSVLVYAPSRDRMIITVEGGNVQQIEGGNAEVSIEVWDFDTEGADPNDDKLQNVRSNAYGEQAFVSH